MIADYRSGLIERLLGAGPKTINSESGNPRPAIERTECALGQNNRPERGPSRPAAHHP